MEINRVIIRDTNLSLFVNEFFKEFVGYIIVFLIDFFSGYNQIKLNKKNKDLTTFHTPIGLLRLIIFFLKTDKFGCSIRTYYYQDIAGIYFIFIFSLS